MPLSHAASPVLPLLHSTAPVADRAPSRISAEASACAVCHGTDLSHDEVDDAGALFLHECHRCAHRWTSRLAPVHEERLPLVAARRRPTRRIAADATPEVASAA